LLKLRLVLGDDGVVGIDTLGQVPQPFARQPAGHGHLAPSRHQVEQPDDVLVVRPARRLPGHGATVRQLADTVALLQRLKGAGHRLYYLSNMPRSYAEHLERQNAFIGDFLDGIFSARVGLMKPHRAIFELASERFSLRGAPTVFIDDHAGNIAAAQAHGWQGVHFSGAAQAERELVDGGWLPVDPG
jgi:FMN phosphatase YigB (HAD superfamily)